MNFILHLFYYAKELACVKEVDWWITIFHFHDCHLGGKSVKKDLTVNVSSSSLSSFQVSVLYYLNQQFSCFRPIFLTV